MEGIYNAFSQEQTVFCPAVRYGFYKMRRDTAKQPGGAVLLSEGKNGSARLLVSAAQ
jgi:hypothetical protein